MKKCYDFTDAQDESFVSIWHRESSDVLTLIMSKYPFEVRINITCNDADIEGLLQLVNESIEKGLEEFSWCNSDHTMKIVCFKDYTGRYFLSFLVKSERTHACVSLNVDIDHLADFMDYSYDNDDICILSNREDIQLSTHSTETATDTWIANYHIIGDCFHIKGKKNMSIEYDLKSLINALHKTLSEHIDFSFQPINTDFRFSIQEIDNEHYEVQLDCSTECTLNYIESSLMINKSRIKELYNLLLRIGEI